MILTKLDNEYFKRKILNWTTNPSWNINSASYGHYKYKIYFTSLMKLMRAIDLEIKLWKHVSLPQRAHIALVLL